MQRKTLEFCTVGRSDARILALWVSPWVQNDGVFDPDHPENRDDQYYGLRIMRQKFAKHGWRVHTQDVVKRLGVTPDAVLFWDVPRKSVTSLIGPWAGRTRLYTMVIEPPFVQPHVWDIKRHKQFEKLFTWRTDLANAEGYVGIHLASKIDTGVTLKRDLSAKNKLCTMIASNKRSRISSSLDLYSKRLECIRWFEENHLDDFDLYGIGWNDAIVRYSWRLRRMGLMGMVNKVVGVEPRPSYRGVVEAKRPVLEGYRFSIAFENSRDLPGYITEKIFDSFLGSCVPVYWGAPDIASFIPADCFIDFRNYVSFEALYARLHSMSDIEYLEYIARIEAFLRSPAASPFSAETLVDTILQQIVG